MTICEACGDTLTAYESENLGQDVGRSLCTECVRTGELLRDAVPHNGGRPETVLDATV